MLSLLRLKHWQLFSLIVVLPLVLILSDGTLSLSPESQGSKSAISILGFALSFGFLLGWFYALGTGLHAKVTSSVKLGLGIFKAAVLIPTAYCLVVCIFMLLGVGSRSSQFHMTGAFIGAFVILHLLSLASMFYLLFFVAKEMKAVEFNRSGSFSDFAGEFFLTWFWPIGIWVIQPRINKLFAK